MILLGLDWLAACASFALGGDELRTTLGETVGLVALGLFGVGEMLLFTLPGLRAAWIAAPLLFLCVVWFHAGNPVAGRARGDALRAGGGAARARLTTATCSRAGGG